LEEKEIEEWIETLSVPDTERNDVPLCPYAKQAWRRGQVKVVHTQDLWNDVFLQVEEFNDTYKVVMCVQSDPEQDYFELEASCLSLNKWFARNSMDIWLLSYQEDEAIVFIQRLSHLDDAADALHKLGYYDNYDAEDYQRLIKQRTMLRRRNEDAW
jgi:hypothetical protein|tara:strand:- start:3258 stop:3725 length:468 start_codon:yes stop_codon:yes gene_type:complete